MARVFAFVTNRGGAGKSSLSSQVAPALAQAHPDMSESSAVALHNSLATPHTPASPPAQACCCWT